MSIVGCFGAQDWPTVPMMGVWWLGQWEGKVFGRGAGWAMSRNGGWHGFTIYNLWFLDVGQCGT